MSLRARHTAALISILLSAPQVLHAGSASVGDCGPGTVRVCGRLTLKNTTQDATDLHFYMYQNDRDSVQVVGAEVSAADCGTVSAALGTDDGTASPPPGNHGAQVDMDNCNIPGGDSVQIEVCLCMNERNCIKFKDIEFTDNGAPVPPPPGNRPPNRGGWRIQRPIQGGSGGNRVPGGGGRGAQEGNGGAGNWIHIVCYENDSNDWIIVDEIKLLASMSLYTPAQLDQKWPNIDPVIDPANPYPICIPPGGRYCYNFETTGAYVGGHIYQRWSVRVDTAGQCTDIPVIQGVDAGADPMTVIGDHPVEAAMLDVLPGDDFFATVQPTQITFGTPEIPAIPANFFGPGSLPFEGTVLLQGDPDPTQGNIDTIVRRKEIAYLDNDGDTTTIPIEIVALNLRSIEPIHIRSELGQQSLFDALEILAVPGGPPTRTALSNDGGISPVATLHQGIASASTPLVILLASDTGGGPGAWGLESLFDILLNVPPPHPATTSLQLAFVVTPPGSSDVLPMESVSLNYGPGESSFVINWNNISLAPGQIQRLRTTVSVPPEQPVQLQNVQLIGGDQGLGIFLVQLQLQINGLINADLPSLTSATSGEGIQQVDRFFDVFYRLSPDFPAEGSMTITRSDALAGGTFTSEVALLPQIIFAPAGGGPVTPPLPGVQPHVVQQSLPHPWTYLPYPGAPADAGPNFFPGLLEPLQWNDPHDDPHTVQAAIAPPRVIAWRSIHTSLGPAYPDGSIPLDSVSFANGTTGPVTEDRSGGVEVVQVDFDQPVILTGLPVWLTGHLTAGGVMGPPQDFAAHITKVSMADADTLEIRISELPNEGCYRIDVAAAVVGADGAPLSGDTDCKVRALIGDADSSGEVTMDDALLIKAFIGAPAGDLLRFDLNLGGTPINLADVLAARSRLKQQALCPE